MIDLTVDIWKFHSDMKATFNLVDLHPWTRNFFGLIFLQPYMQDMEKNARPPQEVNSRDISMFRPFQQNRH
uniref:Uncharacterized protein n=1 Tax=Aegilops tauschii subsp. strangulata TaxID=200361 RepID=A0A453QLX9_AEGTS